MASPPNTPADGVEQTGVDRGCGPSTERYHPYDQANAKRKPPRKVWHHALEKPLFTMLELTTLGTPQRRPIYQASLEAHIDSLGPDFFPVDLKELEPLKGLHAKTCKGMVVGLHHDIWEAHERLLELQRTVGAMPVLIKLIVDFFDIAERGTGKSVVRPSR
ncbi:hypothetical protein DFH07DRAFT_727693 [Mycena maculata]|uniref:Uncharacterized protein n=1 Tax=Mycena maculata TaxID=230809 RepID=A0AAD7P0Y5_9AGAR|nr:hypothetical protein DFH07DRAFT_727693 [Mycena maculata]